MNKLTLMDYPGDTPPFQPGDTVECIEDRKPSFYSSNKRANEDLIRIGDKLKVFKIDKAVHNTEPQWWVLFEGKAFFHSARLFRKVEGGEK